MGLTVEDPITPTPPARGRGGKLPACDGCEKRPPSLLPPPGWQVRIIRQTIEWFRYGIEIGLPEQLHKGDRFTFCTKCADLLHRGMFRALARRGTPDFAQLETVTRGNLSAAIRVELAEHVATLRRIRDHSDAMTWDQWQAQ